MRRYLPSILTICLFATLATAGAIKSWSSSETLRSADLNSNFSHIHNNMVGGHGARLVNADVSASAAISTSKLAAGVMLPLAWAYVTVSGCPGACVITTVDSSGNVTPTRIGVGVYNIALSPAISTTVGAGFCQPSITGAFMCAFNTGSSTTTNLQVVTATTAYVATDNISFSLVVYGH